MHVCSIMTEYNLRESSAHKLHFLPEKLASQTIEIYFYACIYSFKEYLMKSLLCHVPGRVKFKSYRYSDEQKSRELRPWERRSYGDGQLSKQHRCMCEGGQARERGVDTGSTHQGPQLRLHGGDWEG